MHVKIMKTSVFDGLIVTGKRTLIVNEIRRIQRNQEKGKKQGITQYIINHSTRYFEV